MGRYDQTKKFIQKTEEMYGKISNLIPEELKKDINNYIKKYKDDAHLGKTFEFKGLEKIAESQKKEEKKKIKPTKPGIRFSR